MSGRKIFLIIFSLIISLNLISGSVLAATKTTATKKTSAKAATAKKAAAKKTATKKKTTAKKKAPPEAPPKLTPVTVSPIPSLTPLTVPYTMNRIFYYVNGQNALASFEEHTDSIDVIAPQSYALDELGNLSGSVDPQVVAVANAHNIKIMPLVVNDGFRRQAINYILDSTTTQDYAIKKLVDEGVKKHYWGWQFDFEQITGDYRDKYSAFVAKAYPQFKQAGLVFSVAVIAQDSGNPADYPNNLWNRVVGAYDYHAIGGNSDFISIMSYDDPESPGPVAGLPWVKKVIDYSLTQVPAAKLSLGIPCYYWKWSEDQTKLYGAGSYQTVADLINNKDYLKKGWSNTEQVPWVTYAKQQADYTIWYENAQSFEKKLQLAMSYNLAGFSAWVLGLEDPNIHRILQKQ